MTDVSPLTSRLVAGFVVLAAASCAGDAPSSGWTTTVDTLATGAVLVRHSPPADPAPTWRLEPELRIGAADGEGPEVFGRIADLAVTDDGRIVVLDVQAQEIRLFAPDGRFLRTLAREGAGPGEIRSANGLVPGPDGLIRVPDVRNGRLSFLHPDSGIVRSHPYNPGTGGSFWDGVVDADGRSWSSHFFRDDPANPIRFGYVGYHRDGTPVDTIQQPVFGSWDARERPGYWAAERDGRVVLTLAVPYYPHAAFVLSPAPHLWTTPQGDPAYRLVRWDEALDTTLILEVARPPVPTPMERADSVTAAWEERFGVSLDRSDIPGTMSPIDDVFFDDDGRLWVHVAAPDHSLRTFDAFDGDDGAYLGTFVTELRLSDRPAPTIRGNTLWGVVRDEMDVPYVVRGRLETRFP